MKNISITILLLLCLSTHSYAENEAPFSTNYSIVADYLFDENFKSSVSGNPNITFLNSNIDFQEEYVFGIERTVLNFAAGTGFRLDVTNLMPDNNYSIAVVFKLADIEGYVKLLDFHNLIEDIGIYNDGGKLDYYPVEDSEFISLVNNTYAQLVITRDSAGMLKGYINQQLVLEFDNTNNPALPSVDNLLHFFRDDNTTSNTENSDATIARITVFNRDLDLQDIQDFPPLDTIFASRFE